MGSGVIVEARGSFSRAPTGTSVCFPGAPGTPSSRGHRNRGSQGRRRRLQAPAAGCSLARRGRREAAFLSERPSAARPAAHARRLGAAAAQGRSQAGPGWTLECPSGPEVLSRVAGNGTPS